MASDPSLDPKAILASLSVTNTTAITSVEGGADTALWRVEQGSTCYALRVFRAEQKNVYRREIAAMEAARQAHLSVPSVHASGFWQERPALLLSWCPGETLFAVLQRRPWRIWPLGIAFGRMQAEIHQVQAPAQSPQQGPDWIAWANLGDPILETALRRVAGHSKALLHLDYHPLNVLTDGTRITAILDWANARPGDPRACVARTYSILMVEPFGPGRESIRLTIARRLLAWSWRRGYELVSGPLSGMALFYSWAGSAMVQDLAHRVKDPDSWWEPRHLEKIQSWTDRWKAYVRTTK